MRNLRLHSRLPYVTIMINSPVRIQRSVFEWEQATGIEGLKEMSEEEEDVVTQLIFQQEPGGFRPADPPKPSLAHAALPYAPHNTSPGSARSSTNLVLTTRLILMGVPYPTPPFTIHTHTNSSPSSETAVPRRVLLSSVSQGNASGA
jgi:hypothetical protein